MGGLHWRDIQNRNFLFKCPRWSMMTALFKEAGYCPEPAKVIDLNEWRKAKKPKS